jgi:WhiB family redox-sensing transcriptional regulator
MAAMSWEADARCRLYDPEIFFDPGVRSQRRAKAICAKCPVREACLAFALQSRTEFGIWGGLSGRERVALVRRSRRFGNAGLTLASGTLG